MTQDELDAYVHRTSYGLLHKAHRAHAPGTWPTAYFDYMATIEIGQPELTLDIELNEYAIRCCGAVLWLSPSLRVREDGVLIRLRKPTAVALTCRAFENRSRPGLPIKISRQAVSRIRIYRDDKPCITFSRVYTMTRPNFTPTYQGRRWYFSAQATWQELNGCFSDAIPGVPRW